MRKNVFGRQLKRDANERKALFRNLMSELILHEQIKTTEQKAKAVKGNVEKLVTKIKRKGLSARVLVSSQLTTEATQKLVNDIAPRFADRPGGYTRIVRLERRLQDNATMVLMEWVEKGKVLSAERKEKKATKAGSKNVEEVMADVVYGKEKKESKKKVTVKKSVGKKTEAAEKKIVKEKKK